MKPNILVLSGYGLNCEEEMEFLFDKAGGAAQIAHINDVIERRFTLSSYQILVIGGGFAYGDDTGAGNAYANKMKNHLWEDIQTFIKQDKLVLGICNGFQILVNLGLLPAVDLQYGAREMGLMPNDLPRYSVRPTDLKVVNQKSAWLKNIDMLSSPISNGEGKLYASNEILRSMHAKGQVALTYTRGPMCEYQNLPPNPNGSIDDIAGITDETGRILGMMPHPERSVFFTQLPNWQLLKNGYLLKKMALPEMNSDFQLFENAITYFAKA